MPEYYQQNNSKNMNCECGKKAKKTKIKSLCEKGQRAITSERIAF